MASQSISSFEGIDTFSNPFNTKDGNVIHCVNLDSFPAGARTKRTGYSTYLGTPDNNQVNSLFSWGKNDGTTLFTYRASGSSLYSSAQGTGDWTLCGNGTITNNAHVSYAVVENTLFVADGAGSTRHSTDGTSFTNTTLAPVAVDLMDYQGRMYAAGTASYKFYSTTGTPTDWTTDSSSVLVPGPGKLLKMIKGSDRITDTKNSNTMFRWDGDSLVDMATKLGPSSPYSVGQTDNFSFYINNLGLFATNGGNPQLLSNPVQRQFYNGGNTGISGTQLPIAPGEAHRYDYFVSLGSVQDDFTNIPMNNAILRYDYQHNHFDNFIFNNFPTAWHSYKDTSGNQQLIFGDASGQVYTYGGTALSDNGTPIETNLVVLIHANLPHIRKDFRNIEIYTNPGCNASVQFMTEDTVPNFGNQRSGAQRWRELGDLSRGYNRFDFPSDSRGKLMYLRIYDSGSNAPFSLYSIHYNYDEVRS